MATTLQIDLDRSSPVPLYFQVAQVFEKAILEGVLKPGDRFIAPNGEEYEVREGADGLGRFVTVTRVTDGKPAIIRSSTKVSVLASDFPEIAKAAAKAKSIMIGRC